MKKMMLSMMLLAITDQMIAVTQPMEMEDESALQVQNPASRWEEGAPKEVKVTIIHGVFNVPNVPMDEPIIVTWAQTKEELAQSIISQVRDIIAKNKKNKLYKPLFDNKLLDWPEKDKVMVGSRYLDNYKDILDVNSAIFYQNEPIKVDFYKKPSGKKITSSKERKRTPAQSSVHKKSKKK